MAHPERQLICRLDGSWELHCMTDDGGLRGSVTAQQASYLEGRGVPVCILGNGLLALGFPGCTTRPIKCDCKQLA